MLEIRTCKRCKTEKNIIFFYEKGKICKQCQKRRERFTSIASFDKKIIRKCLCCDKLFESTGNRKCDQCNSSHYDEIYSSVSCFVSCG